MDSISDETLATEISMLEEKLKTLKQLQALRFKKVELESETKVVIAELKAVERKSRLVISKGYAEIPLGGRTYGVGIKSLVDFEDEKVAQEYSWTMNCKGYIATAGSLYLHQVVVRNTGTVVLPGYEIHHKNGIKHDNRRSNLDIITVALNRAKKHMDPRNKSGWPGVKTDGEGFSVTVRRAHVQYYKGKFSTFEEAKAWQIAAVNEWETKGTITV